MADLSSRHLLGRATVVKESAKRDSSLHEAELRHELGGILQSIGLLQKDVRDLQQNVMWHHLEQKWANQVTQVGEEMQRVIQQVKGDPDKLDNVVKNLQLRDAQLRSQITSLEAEVKAKGLCTE